MTALRDNAQYPMAGVIGRVLCAMDREAITAGRDERHGNFLRFTTQRGDVSANDNARYAPGTAPMRSFITAEELGNVPRWGKRITQHFGFVFEEGPALLEKLFTVFSQENAMPSDGNWQSPVLEFGAEAIGRTTIRADGKTIGVKDPATGRPFLDEFFRLEVRTLNAVGKGVVVGTVYSKKPLVRGRYYDIAIAFVDSQGKPDGLIELWIDGVLQGRYRGATGYLGFRSPYPAQGIYQHVGQSAPQAVRIYGYREDKIAA